MTPASDHPITRAATVAALAISLALSGCKSTPAPATDDASLNAALQSRLQSDPGLAGQPFQASVKDGVATLTGTVTNPAARSLAANDASQVAGIRTVINSLSLVAPAPTEPEVVTTPPPAPVKPIPAKRDRVKVPPPQRARVEPPPPPMPAPIERPEPQTAQVDPTPPPPPPPAPKPAPPAFRTVRVPSGTELPVRITQTLDSASTQAGTSFSGTLASDVIVDGLIAFPTGTKVSGRVEDVKDAGHFSGNSLLAVSLTSVSRRGETFPITTDTYSKQGNGRGKNTAEKVGGGAAIGAILGGILGGGKGAAIGAASGGGIGAGVNGVTRGQQVQIPSESLVRFRLNTEISVKASLKSEGDDNGDLQHHDQ
ncbi:BON domain-containing protein [Granulicella sibirica]|uniref:BON domain-containing protein n=1 Tax=Granulicella sibirica TaxID=2479048 RepID=A0A4Q0T2K7_9BACT|nr:BON domain-containing protein [Granulicella sibirica]RXH57447.1 hypothetical protein GRAN_0757 [Granulicella sibirica]